MRRMLMVTWLGLILVAQSWAAVVPDASQLPSSDPDAPAPGVSAPTQSPSYPESTGLTTSEGQSSGSSTGNPAASSAAGSSGATGSSAGPGSAPADQATPGTTTDGVSSATFPNGQPLPWSLIAMAVLLFGFAIGGGVYFFQNRED